MHLNLPPASALGHIRSLAAAASLDVATLDASMASEDLAFMLAARPGAYIWLGSQRDGPNPGLHSPEFDFNDAIMQDGIGLWVEVVRRALRPN